MGLNGGTAALGCIFMLSGIGSNTGVGACAITDMGNNLGPDGVRKSRLPKMFVLYSSSVILNDLCGELSSESLHLANSLLNSLIN
jgi:hypothetical protein